jgi:tRNA threonylcarbamoyladenosine biosynthesis protein TsaB
MILAIETSASVCAVGFYSNSKVIDEYNSNAPMKHSELIGHYVEQGLAKINEEIHLVAVAVGPGSFTGLRIGLSYAQGFCFGKNIPIVGVSNHQLLARQSDKTKKTFTVIDAHRQELYLAGHKHNYLMDIESHKIIRRTDIDKELPSNSQLIFVRGTLDKKTVNKLSDGNIICLETEYKTSVLSELGQIKFSQQGEHSPENLEPMYIRSFAGVK